VATELHGDSQARVSCTEAAFMTCPICPSMPIVMSANRHVPAQHGAVVHGLSSRLTGPCICPWRVATPWLAIMRPTLAMRAIMQPSCMQSSCSHHAAIMQPSCCHNAAIMRSSCGHHAALMRQGGMHEVAIQCTPNCINSAASWLLSLGRRCSLWQGLHECINHSVHCLLHGGKAEALQGGYLVHGDM
jgi:hypothetical protein